jgi:hypothetical protein
MWAGFNCGSFTLSILYPVELLRVYAACEFGAKKSDLKYNRFFKGNKAVRKSGKFQG